MIFCSEKLKFKFEKTVKIGKITSLGCYVIENFEKNDEKRKIFGMEALKLLKIYSKMCFIWFLKDIDQKSVKNTIF